MTSKLPKYQQQRLINFVVVVVHPSNDDDNDYNHDDDAPHIESLGERENNEQIPLSETVMASERALTQEELLWTSSINHGLEGTEHVLSRLGGARFRMPYL